MRKQLVDLFYLWELEPEWLGKARSNQCPDLPGFAFNRGIEWVERITRMFLNIWCSTWCTIYSEGSSEEEDGVSIRVSKWIYRSVYLLLIYWSVYYWLLISDDVFIYISIVDCLIWTLPVYEQFIHMTWGG